MFARKIILSICLLQLVVGGIFAQEGIAVQILHKTSDSAINNAIINAYCNGKLQQFVVNETGIINLPANLQPCIVAISALGFETVYNITFNPAITNIVRLDKKNSAFQEVVITGYAKNILAENSIYKVQTINAKKIQQQGAQHIGEALQFENGINQQQDNILGAGLNIQGIGAQNVKVLMNGVPVNGRENGNLDLSTIGINNADRIEFIKGPMSVMYGTDALGGVINIITKQPRKNITLSTYAETINKINTSVTAGFTKKRHAVSINGTRNFFGGWLSMDTFNRNLLWRPKQQHLLDASYVYSTSKGKVSYTPSYMQELVVSKGTPSVDPFSAYATDEYYNTKRTMHTMQVEFNLDTHKKINISTGASIYKRIKNRYAINMMDLTRNLTSNEGDQDTSSFIDITARGTYNYEKKSNYSVVAGFEMLFQDATSLKLDNIKHSINDLAIFASVPIAITKNISLQPALRASHNSQYKAPLTPSLHISAKLPKGNVLRVSAAQGFRAPSLKELYLNFVDINHKIKGNTNLKAEKSLHVQANLDYNLLATQKMKIKNSSSIYYNDIKNQISLAVIDAPTNWYQYANINNFKNIAIEHSTKFQLDKINIALGLGANTILTADSGKGISTWDATYQQNIILNKHNTALNVFYKYIHKQPLLTLSNFGGDALYTSYLPAMHQANANISQSFFKNKLQLQLGLKNIFNIRTLAIQGNANSAIHSNGSSQNISPTRSYFIALRYGILN